MAEGDYYSWLGLFKDVWGVSQDDGSDDECNRIDRGGVSRIDWIYGEKRNIQ